MMGSPAPHARSGSRQTSDNRAELWRVPLRADIAVNVAPSGHSRYCRRHLGGPSTSFNNTALAADFGVRRRAKALALAGVRRRALVLGGLSVGVRTLRG